MVVTIMYDMTILVYNQEIMIFSFICWKVYIFYFREEKKCYYSLSAWHDTKYWLQNNEYGWYLVSACLRNMIRNQRQNLPDLTLFVTWDTISYLSPSRYIFKKTITLSSSTGRLLKMNLDKFLKWSKTRGLPGVSNLSCVTFYILLLQNLIVDIISNYF